MLGSNLKQSLTVGPTSPDFQRLAARLSLSVDSLDIEQNGLGYNDLIIGLTAAAVALNVEGTSLPIAIGSVVYQATQ